MTMLDRFITDFDRALRVVSGVAKAARANPARRAPDGVLTQAEQADSAGMMRVNHVGEVCAQALYDAQGRFARTSAVKAQFALAGSEEEDHLAWTAERLQELGSHTSLLNPVWYGASYVMGVVAAKWGDPINLGFVAETEHQVEQHLRSHLDRLPLHDAKSRAILEQMQLDEAAHAEAARQLGGKELPRPVKSAMRGMSKVMTTVAYYI
jgi:ubiquinone biosynthesis monooxygenase Coq7